jgi:glycosyltransferase involved in cell wall biosynthesis
MSGARVSIVIPSYNLQDYLEECLRSVLAQDFAEWEAIVVDDCSTKGDPAAIIEALRDPRIRLLRHTVNRGLGAARNTGFEDAGAPLVLPLDGDDLLTPDFLSKLLALLERDPEADCAFCDFELFGAETGVRAHQLEQIGVMTRYQWLPGAGVLMRRELWERAGKYNEDPVLRLGNEDWDFWLRAAEQGFRAAHLPEPLYRYRQHVTNMSHGLRAQDHVTRRYLLQHHRAFFAKHGGAEKFLATGYWHAADVAHRRGRPVATFALACRAVALDHDWPRARNTFSRLLPQGLLTHLRRRTA